MDNCELIGVHIVICMVTSNGEHAPSENSAGLPSATNPKPKAGVTVPLPAQVNLISAKGRATYIYMYIYMLVASLEN